MIESPCTVMFSTASGSWAGPLATVPSRLNLLPWHGQSMVPSATLFTVQPAWVQIAEKPLNSPADGCVTTILSTITPEPTGTSAVLTMTLLSSGAVPPVVGGGLVGAVVSPDASGCLP